MQDLTTFLEENSVLKINNAKLLPTSKINPKITNIDEILKQIEISEQGKDTFNYLEMVYVEDYC